MGWKKVGEDKIQKHVMLMHFNHRFKVGDIIQTENGASPKVIKVADGVFAPIK